MNAMKALRRRAGFTVLEVMTASAILGVILTVAAQATQRAIQHSKNGAIISSKRTRARVFLNRMVRELQSTSTKKLYKEDTAGSNAFTARKQLTPADGSVSNVRFQCVTGYVKTSGAGVKAGDPIFESGLRGYQWNQTAKKLIFYAPGAPGSSGMAIESLDDVSAFSMQQSVVGSVSINLTVDTPDPEGRIDTRFAVGDPRRLCPIRVFESARLTTPLNP